MLLIRGLSSKEYALPADDGLIGCRDLACDCVGSGNCEKSLSFSLNPVIPQLEWIDQILGVAHSIQKATLAFSRNLSNEFWRLSCTCCPDKQQNEPIFVKLRPYKIIWGGGVR